MSDLVIDASAVIDLLVEGPRTSALESHIAGATLVAPDLVGLEVLSALGRLLRAGRLAPPDVERARQAWHRTSVRRMPLEVVEQRVWQLRDQVRITDGYYVACAELFDAALLTCDARLARAPLTGVSILLVQ